MICVERGPEPQAVADARSRHLARAIEAFNRHGPMSRALKSSTESGYDAGKKTLYIRQHRKCAYCERRPGYEGEPLEHFRPKKEAWRASTRASVGQTDPERYWWLTWTWSNQLFACTHCNSRKANYFPLAGAPLATPPRPCSLPLPPGCSDLASEIPLLLDPADPGLDPLDHLAWRPVDSTLAPCRWTWELVPLSEAGEVTATLLGLDDREDDVNDRYRETVWPRFDREVLTRPSPVAAAAWPLLAADLTQPSAEFTAATWHILEELRVRVAAPRGLDLAPAARP